MSRRSREPNSIIVVYLMFYIIACAWWANARTPWYVSSYLAGINVLALVAFFVDKGRAIRGEWRIPEVRLHLLTLAGGVLGSGAGMVLAHHKVRKLGFHAVYFLGVVTFCMIASALAPPASSANKTSPATATSPTTPHKAHSHTRHPAAAPHAS